MAIPASVYYFQKRKNDGTSKIPAADRPALINKFKELIEEFDLNDVMVWAAPMYDEELEEQIEDFIGDEIQKYGYDNTFEALRSWLVYDTEHGQDFLKNYYTVS